MELARAEQRQAQDREKLRKQQMDQQKKYIQEYREMKRKTNMLLGEGVHTNSMNQDFQDLLGGPQNPLFYERQQNFGNAFPITTTTNTGKVITT